MNHKKNYNLAKIRTLTKFDDVLNEKLRDPEYKKRHLAALKHWDLAHKIMLARKKAAMTQTEFANKFKTSQSFIARAENGGQNLTIDVLMRMADALSAKLRKPIKFQIVGSV